MKWIVSVEHYDLNRNVFNSTSNLHNKRRENATSKQKKKMKNRLKPENLNYFIIYLE